MKKKELKLRIKTKESEISHLYNDIDKILNNDWMVKEKYKMLLSVRKEAERIILRPFSESLKFVLIYKNGMFTMAIHANNMVELKENMEGLIIELNDEIGIISNDINNCEFVAKALDIDSNIFTYIKNVDALESDNVNCSFDAFIYCLEPSSIPIYPKSLISLLR